MKSVVLQLLLLVFTATVSAFYPFYPEYLCLEQGTCKPEKRAVRASESVVVKLHQRIPKVDIPREAQVSRLSARLRGKYRGIDTIQPSLVEKPFNSRAVPGLAPVVSAVPPTQPNSVGLDNDGHDWNYFATVYFGSEKTPMSMLLDTGASNTWVMSNDCLSHPCTTHHTFGSGMSTTLKTLPDQTFSVTYGSGTVSGIRASDQITIADIKLQMQFGLANVTSSDFDNFNIDGILGLARNPTADIPTFIDTLTTSKAIKSNIFGMFFARVADGPNTGEISFGAADTSKYTGDLAYAPLVDNSGNWQIPLGNVGYGTTQLDLVNQVAYIDSGSTYIFPSKGQADKLHNLIPGAKPSPNHATDHAYTVPCDTTTPLTFTIGGVTYSIPTKDWIGPMANGVCISNVYNVEVAPGSWLLGDTFLKSVYTVFDVDQNRIGFAVAKTATSATGSSSGAAPSSTSTGNPSTTIAASAQASANPINGHQTPSSGGIAVPETTSPSASQKSDANCDRASTLFAFAVALFVMVAS